MTSPMPVLVAAHHEVAGPGAAVARALLREVARQGVPVHPDPVGVMAARVVQGYRAQGATVVVVPLAVAGGYRAPAFLQGLDAGEGVALAPCLGPDPRLVELLAERLDLAGALPRDAVVVAGGGPDDGDGRDRLAAGLRLLRQGPVTVAGRSTRAAVFAARAAGARRVAVASVHLGAGTGHELLERVSGADVVTAPVGRDARLVGALLDRYREARCAVDVPMEPAVVLGATGGPGPTALTPVV
ncbi:sirohydrochlorin chelatase [Cellulomonas bogoriensis]